ncbi:MAG: meso-butanediol dehydrogenase/(S,S)-butanediol dehydrogenase/diacetyl reductase [Natrialbaceae archaeon]|jgi:meso-butanediol dehydrogenase/(S,S)-butanediol dehydrogenase/diacetyl reductase
MPTHHLEGKVAVVTGGGRGIGKGIAHRFAEEGMNVAVVDTDRIDYEYNQYDTREIGGYDEAQGVAPEIEELGSSAMALDCDVTKADQVHDAVDTVIDEWGGIDVMVNNAGIITAGFLEELDEEEWDALFNVNVKGVFLGSRAVIPHMKERGDGRIINTASIAGKMPFPGLAHYVASKYAVVGLTKTIAMELADAGVTANAICPGILNTAMWENVLTPFFDQPFEKSLEQNIPQGTEQTPEDMADLAVYFATNPHVTGQAVNVDGGARM